MILLTDKIKAIRDLFNKKGLTVGTTREYKEPDKYEIVKQIFKREGLIK